tara:strand:+ start:1573 stop:1824 length:252 start_codon:yes stop_codon:yes gene_type:complete
MYEWKIRVAPSLRELEKLVEQVQSEGWTIEKIDVKSVCVVAYRAKRGKNTLLLEQQDEGHINPSNKEYPAGFEWDMDYGQQSL